MAKRKDFRLQLNENITSLKVIYAVHTDLKLDCAFNLVQCLRGVQDQIPDSTPLYKIFCFLTHSNNFAVSRFVLRQCGFRFFTIKFLRQQQAILFVEDMAKRKVIVLSVNEINTFLKVLYAVHIDLKLDIAFNFVLLSTRGVRSISRLYPIV